MTVVYQCGQTPTFMARITNSELDSVDDYSLLNSDDVESIRYSIVKTAGNPGGGSPCAVTGHVNQPIPLTALLENLETNDPNWAVDDVGYNFKFSPDSRVHCAFPESGSYRITFTIVPTVGNPIVWSRRLQFD